MTLRDSLPASPHSVWGRHHRRYRWNAKDRIPATWEVNWVIWFGLLSAFRISPSKGSFFQKLTCLLIQEKWVYFSTEICEFQKKGYFFCWALLPPPLYTICLLLLLTEAPPRGGGERQAGYPMTSSGGVSHDVKSRAPLLHGSCQRTPDR